MVERWTSDRRTEDKDYWRQLLAKEVQLLPSVAIYTAPGGRAVSWELLHLEGNLGTGHVEPEFRGQGFSDVLMAVMMIKTARLDVPLFGYVRQDNHVMHRTLKPFGDSLAGEVQFLHCATRARAGRL